jgi:hypothetical protein
MVKQMLGFQRTLFNGLFNNMTVVGERTQKVMDMFLNHAVWVPEEWKNAFGDWAVAYEQGCDTFRKTVNESFEKMEHRII